MNGKRFYNTIRLFLISSGTKRAEYLYKHNVFYSMGTSCVFMDRKVPLYPKLIKIGNNVHFSSNVTLATHDIIHLLLNGIHSEKNKSQYNERVGCIEIEDNVYIGSNTTILYNTKIGSNVIIGAGSVVTKDVPSNSVVVGVPAKRISSFDDYVLKLDNKEVIRFIKHKGSISDEDCKKFWDAFYNHRDGEGV